VARFRRFPVLVIAAFLPLPYADAAPSNGPPPGDRSPGRGGPVAYDVEFAPNPAWNGISGALLVTTALPGARLVLPIDWGVVTPPQAWYRWVPVASAGEAGAAPRPLTAPPSPAEAGDVPQPIGAGAAAHAPQRPGIYTLEIAWPGGARHLEEAVLLVKRPAAEKQNGRLGGYRIGSYPSGGGRYAQPAGFIEVSRAHRDLHVSRNFTLSNFLTKDQFDVWPKYVLIDPLLLEKLELVLLELREMGVPAERMHVMSGYRTPQYNARGVGSGGRAALSRHQYGDAADVWIETLDRPGRMADLNGDGRIDTGDARVILAAVERVEAKHPHLVGGAGVYAANSAHPPFLHIDVRGQRSRW
jgi:uncharacterized protein YcbK (DUF882 family)